ncbi:hypothetical protein GSI_05056 [Ganoderma sinense ZZ0214-1]|uniref:Uncharacterized protein n=1 Tax=Ganoderma sinense ZZ0214-1 TaxID=1077348 RepID=A0A2G8SH89_9APHY|nr:hypothetical protein GSI_05056 [Ganoderma sinense ZZ0214-1]
MLRGLPNLEDISCHGVRWLTPGGSHPDADFMRQPDWEAGRCTVPPFAPKLRVLRLADMAKYGLESEEKDNVGVSDVRVFDTSCHTKLPNGVHQDHTLVTVPRLLSPKFLALLAIFSVLGVVSYILPLDYRHSFRLSSRPSTEHRETCPPRTWAAGEWVPKPPPTTRTNFTQPQDASEFLGLEGCASSLSPEEMHMSTDFELAGAGAVLSDVTALSLAYRVEGRVTLPSDGVAHRVVIAVLAFGVGLTYVCVLRWAGEVFIEGRVRNMSEYEWLAGPVNVFVADGFVTKTRLGLIGVNESFTCVLRIHTALKVAMQPKSRTEHEPTRSFAEPSKTTTRTVTATVTNGHPFDVGPLVPPRTCTPPWTGEHAVQCGPQLVPFLRWGAAHEREARVGRAVHAEPRLTEAAWRRKDEARVELEGRLEDRVADMQHLLGRVEVEHEGKLVEAGAAVEVERVPAPGVATWVA